MINILEFLKKGSGIHIKKENRGKFTSYCGGKVTDECIQKGKNSSNPAIRKRATFADNARHFKHRSGAQNNKIQSNQQNYYAKKGGSIKTANARKWKHQEGGVLIDYSGDNPNAMGGDIVTSVIEYLKHKKQIQEQQKDQELMKKYLEIQKSQQTSNMIQDLLGTTSNYITNNLGGLSKIFSKKKSTTDNGSPSTTSMYKLSDFWSNPTIANSLT